MAGSKSNYLEAELLDHCYGGADYVRPGTVYIGLFTAAPTDAGGGTEAMGGSYARVAVTNNVTNWPAASGTAPTAKSNGTVITFPTATADWGTIVAFAIFDASSGGNLLNWATLTTNRDILTGDVGSFAVGTLVITED